MFSWLCAFPARWILLNVPHHIEKFFVTTHNAIIKAFLPSKDVSLLPRLGGNDRFIPTNNARYCVFPRILMANTTIVVRA
jgi:hypothetical protein